jgi:hypothetical protein
MIKGESIPPIIQIRLFAFNSSHDWTMEEAEDDYVPSSRQSSQFGVLHAEVAMRKPFSPCLNDWKTLYQAAILETNRGLLPQRVSEAEEAVKARGREIFYGNRTPEEKEAEILEDALYTLRAFRTAWQHGETA